MASIELNGQKIEAPTAEIAFREIGFGADEVTFKVGEATVTVSVLELIELKAATRAARLVRGFPAS